MKKTAMIRQITAATLVNRPRHAMKPSIISTAPKAITATDEAFTTPMGIVES